LSFELRDPSETRARLERGVSLSLKSRLRRGEPGVTVNCQLFFSV
jgi:hypothetical protein